MRRARLSEAGALLELAARRAQPLATLSPRNFGLELARLGTEIERGAEVAPRFLYQPLPVELPGLRTRLERLRNELDPDDPVEALHRNRAAELMLEIRMAQARETPQLAGLAAERYAVGSALAEEADNLAMAWLSEAQLPLAPDDESMVVSDDASDHRSLLSRLREEVFRRRLPVRVRVGRGLAPLAAVGEGEVWVSAARQLSVADVERTVVHEVEGHLLPQLVAPKMGLGIFSSGTEKGNEGQEGYALWLEDMQGHLRSARRRVLALRHVAARKTHRGASIEEVFARLRAHGAPVAQALAITLRVFRGGGLGREAGYLPQYLAVRSLRDAGASALLATGRVEVGAARVLAEAGYVAPPVQPSHARGEEHERDRH